jgi:hypothetical protein
MRLRSALIIPIIATAALALLAGTQQSPSVALTVYSDNNAIVKEIRSIDVPEGIGEIRFEDVAATIDPTSVTFRSLSDPQGTTILEQNYEYDLVSADKLLEKYLGKAVEAVTKDGSVFKGRLMSFDEGQLVISTADGPLSIVVRADNTKSVTCGSLPEGLVIKPTLMWRLQSTKGGSQLVEVAYNASHCSWKADYSMVLNDNDTAFDLDGWVTLANNTGKTYQDARLKLVAGDVHRVEQPAEEGAYYIDAVYSAATPNQFQEKAFAEYHLYTLPRPTTIKDRQIKQVELLTAKGAPVLEKKYLFDPMRDFTPSWDEPMKEDFSVAEKGKVQVFIAFKNDEKSHLGMPLPAGRVRLFKYDGTDLEFVGEDNIDHTPKDEKVELDMGNAFDITGERKRTNFVTTGHRMDERFEIALRSHKTEAVTVYAREHMVRWTNWTIMSKSQDFTKVDAQTVDFPVTLQPDEEKTVTYTVTYSW